MGNNFIALIFFALLSFSIPVEIPQHFDSSQELKLFSSLTKTVTTHFNNEENTLPELENIFSYHAPHLNTYYLFAEGLFTKRKPALLTLLEHSQSGRAPPV